MVDFTVKCTTYKHELNVTAFMNKPTSFPKTTTTTLSREQSVDAADKQTGETSMSLLNHSSAWGRYVKQPASFR